jgi:DNA-binding PadR family transcriptional regulator
MSSHDLNATAASLLGFLQEGPKTGWDLVEVIESSVGNFWNVTRSQVYRELKTLATAGLVRHGATGPRERLPYEITATGRQAFSRFLAEEGGGDTLRLPIVVKVFFGDQMPPELLRQHLAVARAAHLSALASYETLWNHPPPHMTAHQRKCLELGIAYETMFLAWIDGQPWAKEPKKKSRAAT